MKNDIHVSVETLRQWMITDGLWVPHAKRKPRVYQPRYRRDCLGELIQIDGSHHDWFSLKELDSMALRFDEYHQLKRMYELDYIPVRSNVVTPLPFRCGRRIKQPQSNTVTKEKKKMYREVAKKRM